MTEVIIRKSKEGAYKGFECSGHAGYADSGYDIVCAAISMLTINTINSIDLFTSDEPFVSSDEESGVIRCSFQSEISKETELLMKSFELGINGVYEQYGKKYLKITIKEV